MIVILYSQFDQSLTGRFNKQLDLLTQMEIWKLSILKIQITDMIK